jgi:hypothetical protein
MFEELDLLSLVDHHLTQDCHLGLTLIISFFRQFHEGDLDLLVFDVDAPKMVIKRLVIISGVIGDVLKVLSESTGHDCLGAKESPLQTQHRASCHE